METEFLKWLRHRLPPVPEGELGLSDDAAILPWQDRADCVATTDLLCEGVHFRLDEIAPERVGRKALAVNLSDLAAMAARPVAALISILLPHHGGLTLARRLYEGLLPLAEQHAVAIAGGDTNSWSGPLVISVTALGHLPSGRLLRTAACPGDAILVTGQLGGSILGHHFDFEPRVAEALLLRQRYDLHAGMDISDGLLLDLKRLMEESQVGAELQLEKIPLSQAAHRLAAQDHQSPLQHALADGEDFELLLTAAPEVADRMLIEQPLTIPITRIGTVVAQTGLWQDHGDGRRTPLEPQGYEHRLDE